MPEFEYTVNYLQEIPHDTIFVEYRSPSDLTWFVNALTKTGHVFIVHPGTRRIAFARSALTDIERLT